MTEPSDDAMEERLRAILRAEAGSVDPSPEALSSIQSRTQRGSGWFAGLLGSPWLRPSLAVGAAAVIAGSVLLGTPQVRDQILPQSLTTPAGQNEAPPEHDGGAPGSDGDDDVSGKTTPEPGGDAGEPSGGAPPPQDDPAEPEETEEGAAPYGATEHCVPGTPPTQAPMPSKEPGTTASTPGTGTEAPPTECDPDEEPTTPTDEPSDEVPGDGSTGGSTPPPGGGGGGGSDTDDGGAPTTGPGNSSSGNAGGDTTALKAD